VRSARPTRLQPRKAAVPRKSAERKSISPRRASATRRESSARNARRAPAARAKQAPFAGSHEAQLRDLEFLIQRRIEDVAQGFVSVASELWIVKDRMAVLEELLAAKGVSAADIDRFEPTGEFKAKLDTARREYARRTVAALFPRGLPKVD
jgi:hypothetical protein